jgi:hypothetical protein
MEREETASDQLWQVTDLPHGLQSLGRWEVGHVCDLPFSGIHVDAAKKLLAVKYP